MKIKEIKNKQIKAVKSNTGRCYVVGKPKYYQGHDCGNDCTDFGKPPSWKSAYL